MEKDDAGPVDLPVRREADGLAGAQGKDFSGLDFYDMTAEGQNFFESIFNGCSFERVRASQSVFQHAEFAETKLSDCVFADTSFDHSDFVLTTITGSTFVRCSFQNAEWRDADFDNVKFRQCIFRNTTTSLARFRRCSFDDASAASFVGASKRFSLFSETDFLLPHQHISFLRCNFGIRAKEPSASDVSGSHDPFLQLSLAYYYGRLTPEQFYRSVTEALDQITASGSGPRRLRLRYLSGICKLLLEQEYLSIFAIQLLENTLSEATSSMPDQDQALELIGLILTLKVVIRERLNALEQEIAELGYVMPSKVRLQFEFENTYGRDAMDEYMTQLATYCGLSRGDVCIQSLRTGSTFAEVVITAAAFVPDIVRFVKCSLSFATVTLLQAGKLRDAYKKLTDGGQVSADNVDAAKTSKPIKALSRPANRGRKHKKDPPKDPPSEGIAKELTGDKLESARPVEVFVDAVGEKVLVVGGKVRVTISVI